MQPLTIYSPEIGPVSAALTRIKLADLSRHSDGTMCDCGAEFRQGLDDLSAAMKATLMPYLSWLVDDIEDPWERDYQLMFISIEASLIFNAPHPRIADCPLQEIVDHLNGVIQRAPAKWRKDEAKRRYQETTV